MWRDLSHKTVQSLIWMTWCLLKTLTSSGDHWSTLVTVNLSVFDWGSLGSLMSWCLSSLYTSKVMVLACTSCLVGCWKNIKIWDVTVHHIRTWLETKTHLDTLDSHTMLCDMICHIKLSSSLIWMAWNLCKTPYLFREVLPIHLCNCESGFLWLGFVGLFTHIVLMFELFVHLNGRGLGMHSMFGGLLMK